MDTDVVLVFNPTRERYPTGKSTLAGAPSPEVAVGGLSAPLPTPRGEQASTHGSLTPLTALPLTSTEEALWCGIRLGDWRLQLRRTARRDRLVLDLHGPLTGPNGVLVELTQQQFRLFVVLFHARLRALTSPGAPALVSQSQLLQAAGVLDDGVVVADRDPQTREVDFPNYLRGPLRQLRERLHRYGIYVYALSATAGRAVGYQLLFQEEFRFVAETPEPWEIDDDVQLPQHLAG